MLGTTGQQLLTGTYMLGHFGYGIPGYDVSGGEVRSAHGCEVWRWNAQCSGSIARSDKMMP
ncbi:MAG: hypothetical protein IPJ76_18960 [Flavobacteriales bacterium]|nr:MAG: hypothetical protein IPJ76_18960 [Flavobacteriales bacterium]